MRGKLSSEDIDQVFRLLNERLMFSGIYGKLQIIGGVALTMHGFDRQATTDIDAIISPEEAILAVAADLSTELELGSDWLNSSASQFLPEGYGEQFSWDLVWEQSNLKIYIPPVEVLLYMKLRAARGKDVEDIRQLIDRLSFTNVQQCEEIVNRYRPGEDLTSNAIKIVSAIYDHKIRQARPEFFKRQVTPHPMSDAHQRTQAFPAPLPGSGPGIGM